MNDFDAYGELKDTSKPKPRSKFTTVFFIFTLVMFSLIAVLYVAAFTLEKMLPESHVLTTMMQSLVEILRFVTSL